MRIDVDVRALPDNLRNSYGMIAKARVAFLKDDGTKMFIINDITLNQSRDRANSYYLTMPSRSYTDRDGNKRRVPIVQVFPDSPEARKHLTNLIVSKANEMGILEPKPAQQQDLFSFEIKPTNQPQQPQYQPQRPAQYQQQPQQYQPKPAQPQQPEPQKPQQQGGDSDYLQDFFV